MPGVITEPAQGHPATDRHLLRWDHRVDPAPLQRTIDLAVSVALVGGDGLDRDPRRGSDGVRLALDFAALIRLSGCHLHVENDAPHVVDRRMLLVGPCV